MKLTSKFCKVSLLLFVSFVLVMSFSDGPTSSKNDNSAEILGFVNTSDTGEGIEAAKISILGNDIERNSYTDSTGYFKFTKVPVGDYTVQLRLPKGFNEIDDGEKKVFVEGDTQVDFLAEPIRQVSTTVQKGKIDTLSTSSGTSVIVDGQNASNDLNISIDETEEGVSQAEDQSGVLIRINPEKTKSSQSFSFDQNDVHRLKISLRLGEEFTELGQYSYPVMSIKNEVDNEMNYSFTKGQIKTETDSNTGIENKVLEHNFEISSTSSIDFMVDLQRFDDQCSESDRSLYQISEKFTGDKPLILVHGWQSQLTKCTDFENFIPEEKSLEALISQLEENSRITKSYKLYAYKYTSNTSVLDNSRELFKKISDMGLEDPVFIAHSMGGLVVRGLMTEYEELNVSGAITLGTPHEGSPTTDLADGVDAFIISACFALSINDSYCLNLLLGGGVFPPTKGFLDLDPSSDLYDRLDNEFQNFYAFGGYLNSNKEIGDWDNSQRFGYLMGYIYIWTSGNRNISQVMLLFL